LASPPKAKEEGRRKGGGREEEGGRKGGGRGGRLSGGKGAPGFHPALPRPTLPHLWAGPPNFGASIVFKAHSAQKSEKIIGAA
jgi:hypothetical protein